MITHPYPNFNGVTYHSSSSYVEANVSIWRKIAVSQMYCIVPQNFGVVTSNNQSSLLSTDSYMTLYQNGFTA